MAEQRSPRVSTTVSALDTQARTAAAAQQWDEAHKLMTRVLEDHSENPECRARMGWYTFNANSVPASERKRLSLFHFEYALNIDPNCALAHFYEGKVHAAEGDSVRARRAFEAALALAPDFADAA